MKSYFKPQTVKKRDYLKVKFQFPKAIYICHIYIQILAAILGFARDKAKLPLEKDILKKI